MLPLTLTSTGDKVFVAKIGGSEEARQHLADLGFVVGTEVTVISANQGNVIVNVRDSRLAVTQHIAAKIMVQPV